MDATLENKGKKKKGQATLAASPPKHISGDEKEDALSSQGSLPGILVGSPTELSPATSTSDDILADLLRDDKDDSTSTVPDDFPTFLKKMGEIETLLYHWQDAKEFPVINPVEVSDEEMDQYIERVLKTATNGRTLKESTRPYRRSTSKTKSSETMTGILEWFTFGWVKRCTCTQG